MSMTLLVVLTLGRAPDVKAWQTALDESRVPIRFTSTPDLRVASGFLPIDVQREASGFYFLREGLAELAVHYSPLAELKIREPVVYSLGYGAHALECAAVFYSASVLVGKFGGIAFDPQAGNFLSEQELSAAARACLQLKDFD